MATEAETAAIMEARKERMTAIVKELTILIKDIRERLEGKL